jgi:hypothetical protein
MIADCNSVPTLVIVYVVTHHAVTSEMAAWILISETSTTSLMFFPPSILTPQSLLTCVGNHE